MTPSLHPSTRKRSAARQRITHGLLWFSSFCTCLLSPAASFSTVCITYFGTSCNIVVRGSLDQCLPSVQLSSSYARQQCRIHQPSTRPLGYDAHQHHCLASSSCRSSWCWLCVLSVIAKSILVPHCLWHLRHLRQVVIGCI